MCVHDINNNETVRRTGVEQLINANNSISKVNTELGRLAAMCVVVSENGNKNGTKGRRVVESGPKKDISEFGASNETR